jgi:hypothetical protein
MSRASPLLAVLTDEPVGTSELYDRVGYRTLIREGLVAYEAFRAELVRLGAAGLAESSTAADGATLWRRPSPGGDTAGSGPGAPAA